MKLQYMKNTSAVTHFHIMMVSINKNMFKHAHVINKLGRFGTVIPLAPVCRAGGKPSTGFPPGTRRAELTFTSHEKYSSIWMYSIWGFSMKKFLVIF